MAMRPTAAFWAPPSPKVPVLQSLLREPDECPFSYTGFLWQKNESYC